MQTLSGQPSSLQQLQQAQSLEAMHQACDSYTEELCASDYMLIKLDLRYKHSTPATLFTKKHFKVAALFTTYSYEHHREALKYSQRQTTPFIELIDRFRCSRLLQLPDFFQLCQSAQLKDFTQLHVYFPFHILHQHTGFFKISGGVSQEQQVYDNIIQGKLFTDYLTDKINTLQANKYNTQIELTHKETLCLYILGDGGSNTDIGEMLGIAPDTVTYHIKKITKKLKAKNRFHALSLAISKNKIPTQL